MPTNLVVNNNTYAYPSDGDEPGWGADATGWAGEVTTVLNGLSGANDIPQTIFTVANNVLSSGDVTGLLFNPVVVRSAVIEYSIYRKTDTGGSEVAEKGTLDIVYKNGGTIGDKWTLGRMFIGDDAGVLFTMTDNGQVQYTASNIAGANYTGTMHFSAKVTLQ